MFNPTVLEQLTEEQLVAVKAFVRREAHRLEIEELADRRWPHRGLKFPPLTCAVCNTRTFLGPLCFDHMEKGRSMWRMWVDHVDPNRRNVRKIEDFLRVGHQGPKESELRKP